MYPETDIPPMPISQDMWKQVMENLPMTQDERRSRLEKFDISEDQLKQLLSRELDDHFVSHSHGLPQKAWATMLLENEGNIGLMALVLAAKEAGHVAREGMQTLLLEFEGQNPTIDQLSSKAEELGLKPADASDLADIVAKVVSDLSLIHI